MSSLFALGHEVAALHLALDAETDENGELPPSLVAWMESAEGRLEDKVDTYCGIIGELEALEAARKTEAARLRTLAAIAGNNAQRMRQAMKEVLDKISTPRVETTRYKVSIRANGGKLPLEIEDGRVPAEFIRSTVVVQVDRDAIRQALELGEDLPFARLGQRGTSLIIR